MTAQQPSAEQQAKFWQTKYFELLAHTNSVIAALARPQMLEARAAAEAALAAAELRQAAPREAK